MTNSMIVPWLAVVTMVASLNGSHAQTLMPDQLAQRAIERRAVEAVNWGMPAVNYDLMLQEMLDQDRGQGEPGGLLGSRRSTGTTRHSRPIRTRSISWRSSTPRMSGRSCIEIPPAGDDGSLNGNIVDIWQMPLEDAGPSGADKGKGGKYLMLPPGYADAVPEGYIALRPATFGGYALLRSNLKSHGDADVAKSVAYGKRVKVYPLSQAAAPPPTVFTDAADVLFDSTIRYDASFFVSLDRIVQSEPWLDRDRAMIDPLRSLGIEKGKPFNPDAKTKAALEAGISEAQAWLEARYDAGLPALLRRQPLDVPGRPGADRSGASRFRDPDKYPGRCPRPHLFLRLYRHQAPGCRPVLSDQHQGQGRQCVRRRQDLSPDRAGERAGRAILVGDGL